MDHANKSALIFVQISECLLLLYERWWAYMNRWPQPPGGSHQSGPAGNCHSKLDSPEPSAQNKALKRYPQKHANGCGNHQARRLGSAGEMHQLEMEILQLLTLTIQHGIAPVRHDGCTSKLAKQAGSGSPQTVACIGLYLLIAIVCIAMKRSKAIKKDVKVCILTKRKS